MKYFVLIIGSLFFCFTRAIGKPTSSLLQDKLLIIKQDTGGILKGESIFQVIKDSKFQVDSIKVRVLYLDNNLDLYLLSQSLDTIKEKFSFKLRKGRVYRFENENAFVNIFVDKYGFANEFEYQDRGLNFNGEPIYRYKGKLTSPKCCLHHNPKHCCKTRDEMKQLSNKYGCVW